VGKAFHDDLFLQARSARGQEPPHILLVPESAGLDLAAIAGNSVPAPLDRLQASQFQGVE
jgi:hypothetical protein